MKKCFFYCFMLMAVMGTISTCHMQEYSSAIQRSDLLLEQFLKTVDIPGLSVAIAKKDRIIYRRAFGMSDIEKKLPATNITKFRIGSVAKLLTAVATVSLIENSVIDRDNRIHKYIKDLPEEYRNMTIDQLAGHTAGIRHYTHEEVASTNTRDFPDLRKALTLFINEPLLADPGEEYHYSSYGYVLLGAVLENACQKKFNDIIKEYVLDKAGMENTLAEIYEHSFENTSQFYYRSENNCFELAEKENFSYKWPASGYLSTAEDLAWFGGSLLSGEIVSAESFSLLFTNHKTKNGEDTACGYGFRIEEDWRGRKVVHHGGESPGARAFFLIYPEQELTIAFLANVFRAPLFEGEAETLAGYFLDDYYREREVIIPGKYTYAASVRDKTMAGKIVIEKNQGMITQFIGGTVPIMDIVLDQDKFRLICVSKNGIINIWLTKDNGVYKGQWGYHKPQNEFSLSK